MRKTSIVIVDDHFMVIEGIKALLSNWPEMDLVGHATNAKQCLDKLASYQPDILLMDINLPDMSGVELCQIVKAKYPSVFVLGLSTYNQFTYIDKMMENGASGYLLKNASSDELIDAIHTALKGKTYLSHEAATTLRNTNETVTGVPLLTRREKEILVLIAEGLTNPEIAEKLFLSISTVDSHRKNLMRKLNFKNTALLIRWAVENKLV